MELEGNKLGLIFIDEEKLNAKKLADYKVKRDELLAETDKIYVLDDYTINGEIISVEQKEELKTYRQELRDAPEKSYPDFPAKPSWL